MHEMITYTYVCLIQKKMVQMNLFAEQEYRHIHREWICGLGRGEVGTNWEIGIDIDTLPYVRQIASRKLLYSTGVSTRCSVMT